MDPLPLLHLTTTKAWRGWLARNHARESVVWLVFHKEHTGRSSIPYEEAVCEALCFGWIDSLIRRIDQDRYARKFTPRTDTARWSASNLRRLEALLRDGRMAPAGLAKVGLDARQRTALRQTENSRPDPPLTPGLRRRLAADAAASAFFRSLPPSEQRDYRLWIMSAKKPETRERRLREAMQQLARGERLGMK